MKGHYLLQASFKYWWPAFESPASIASIAGFLDWSPCSKEVVSKHLQLTTNLKNFLEIMGQQYGDTNDIKWQKMVLRSNSLHSNERKLFSL